MDSLVSKTFLVSTTVLSNTQNIAGYLDYIQNTCQYLIKPFLNDSKLDITIHCNSTKVKKVDTIDLIDWVDIAKRKPQKLTILFSLRERVAQNLNPYLAGLSISCISDLADEQTGGSYTIIEVGIKPKLIGQSVTMFLQQTYVNWFLGTLREFGGVNGYITYDYHFPNATMPSPYEMSIGLTYSQIIRNLHKQTRGYYWGNFLNLTHIKSLGGESKLSEIPAYLVQKVNSIGYYVQLSESINKVNLNELAKLKNFLKPILPQPIMPVTPEYEMSWPYLLVHEESSSSTHEVRIKQTFKNSTLESRIFEARSWLSDTNHPAALAANRFKTTQAAKDFVEMLYQIGAEKVYVKIPPFGSSYSSYADMLIVKMPTDPESRKKIYAVYLQELVQEQLTDLGDNIDDNGEDELHFWWD